MVWCDQHQFNQFKGATMIAAADSEEEKADDTDITFMDQGGRGPALLPSRIWTKGGYGKRLQKCKDAFSKIQKY